MPDFTIETMQQCAKLEFEAFTVRGSKGQTYTVTFSANERTGPVEECTCPAFRYSGGRGFTGVSGHTGTCKHIAAMRPRHCDWHELTGKAIEQDGTCPECGGPTQYVRVAV
jgi:hypothetical protein